METRVVLHEYFSLSVASIKCLYAQFAGQIYLIFSIHAKCNFSILEIIFILENLQYPVAKRTQKRSKR